MCFFPPATLAALFSEEPFFWGSQNFHFKTKGAYTGENSLKTFKELGAQFCLLGHSERRYIFGESDVDIEKKVSLSSRARVSSCTLYRRRSKRKTSKTASFKKTTGIS